MSDWIHHCQLSAILCIKIIRLRYRLEMWAFIGRTNFRIASCIAKFLFATHEQREMRSPLTFGGAFVYLLAHGVT